MKEGDIVWLCEGWSGHIRRMSWPSRVKLGKVTEKMAVTHLMNEKTGEFSAKGNRTPLNFLLTSEGILERHMTELDGRVERAKKVLAEEAETRASYIAKFGPKEQS